MRPRSQSDSLTPENLATMTLQQKASLLTGGGFWSTTAIPELGLDELILSNGPHGVRRQLAGEDHLGLHHSEPATCFPPAVAVGSSWNTEVATKLAAALAVEARTLGVRVVLGPGVNIKRSPLGGRNFEYFSEDPLLSGVLGTAYVRSLQSAGVGASLKHFAVNDQETERMIISADVDERALREVHLAAFERVVTEADPATVMCAYNKVNGVHASENHWLLSDVLRGEWGYRGTVISNWGAVRDRVASLNAGLDLAMPGPSDHATQLVVDAVRARELDESVVDRAVERVLALVGTPGSSVVPFDIDRHHQLARDLATECAVLLKNDHDVLPLSPAATILVVGKFAAEPRFQGGGSSNVQATRVDVPLHCMEAHVAAHGGSVRFLSEVDHSEAGTSELLEAAQAVEVAVVFTGNPESEESEGFDRERLDLPSSEVRLIKQVAASVPRTVVVLANGGVVTLEDWHDDVDAILEGFLLGQGGGNALSDLLFGLANPSGRLAESVPLRLQDTPTYLTFPGEQGHVRYGEGVMVGYRHYETVGAAVRYPFGHGLSYTTYQVSELQVAVTGPDEVAVTVSVTNTGHQPGQHVVQVYVSTTAGPVRRPIRTLAAFAKVALIPGETTIVQLVLDRRAFAYWDISLSRWVVAPGAYTVQVNADASTVLHAREVELLGDDQTPSLTLQATVAEWLTHPATGAALAARMAPIVADTGHALDDGSEQMRAVTQLPMNQLLNIMGGAIDSDWLVSLLTEPEPAAPSTEVGRPTSAAVLSTTTSSEAN